MEFERFVIDSNVFVALYSKADSHHKEAYKVFRELESKALIVHPYVIQETATVLAYKLGQKAAVKFLNDIEDAANIVVPLIDIRKEMASFISIKKKISFTDAVLVGLAKTMSAKLITFDSQMLALFKKA